METGNELLVESDLGSQKVPIEPCRQFPSSSQQRPLKLVEVSAAAIAGVALGGIAALLQRWAEL